MAAIDRWYRGVQLERSGLRGWPQIPFQSGPSDRPNDDAFGAQIFEDGCHSIGGGSGGEDIVYNDPRSLNP